MLETTTLMMHEWNINSLAQPHWWILANHSNHQGGLLMKYSKVMIRIGEVEATLMQVRTGEAEAIF